MQKRRMGTSELMVSPIGLGCWQFSEGGGFAGKFWDALSPEVEQEIVSVSLEGGINWFDTAEAYGLGRSERALAKSLSGLGMKPSDVIVASKWLPLGRFAGSITSTIDQRLDCLRPFPIDLYQIHFPASFSGLKAQAKHMAGLVKSRKIRHVGVSNFSGRLTRSFHRHLAQEGVPLVSNQVRYSLLDRRIERNGTLEAAKELGVTIIAYSPLDQGILTGVYHDDPGRVSALRGVRKARMASALKNLDKTRPLIEELKRTAQKHNVTPAQVALNWLITFNGDTVIAIPGASKRTQAESNAHAMSFTLTEEQSHRIDEISQGLVR